MSKQPETKFKERALRDLRAIPFVWVVKIQQVALRGIPDLLISAGGKFVAIELKKDRYSKPSKLQVHTLEAIRATNALALVAYPENWSDILDQIGDLAADHMT